MATPTLRSLAKTLNLSRTTVSDALRHSSRVKAATIARVEAAAKVAGYEHNPLTGTVMSMLRRSSSQEFRGVIAAIDVIPADRTGYAVRYRDALMAGIRRRGAELGFNTEKFEVRPKGMTLRRVNGILRARGIKGLVLLPAVGSTDFATLDWSHFTGVYTDYFIDQPSLHCVCADHYRSMVALLQNLHQRGYRRPGLFMDVPLDLRLQYRWEGAFLAMQSHLFARRTVPPLLTDKITREAFLAWFKNHRPDVVIGHDVAGLTWMREAGIRVPEEHAFVCLNSLRATPECATLDFQAAELGARATELLIVQLLQNAVGEPLQPSLSTIPAQWIEGKTVLAQKSPTKRLPGKRGKSAPVTTA